MVDSVLLNDGTLIEVREWFGSNLYRFETGTGGGH